MKRPGISFALYLWPVQLSVYLFCQGKNHVSNSENLHFSLKVHRHQVHGPSGQRPQGSQDKEETIHKVQLP